LNPVTQNKDYRADIDGLRAIAILAVMVYHITYQVNITKTFSFRRFYLKRVRRILPALLVMMSLVICFEYFVFTPHYFREVGKQVFSATLSFSNIYLIFRKSEHN